MASFDPNYIKVFVGGRMRLPHPQTVGELRQWLKDFDKELSTWGDDQEVSSVDVVDKHYIEVNLKEGIWP